MRDKEHHFDLQAWYCGGCNRYFYTDNKNRDDPADFTCPHGCYGGLEYNGRFKVSGKKCEE